jgi:hypothetical protein
MMFGYELQREQHNELRRRADEWRLAREAKAARMARRRARRTRSRTAVRTGTGTGAEGAPSPSGSLGRIHRVLHPRSAA